jgi:triosephosphate isomerase
MIIASNFKTNHTRASTTAFFAQVEAYIKENGITDDVMVFPTATSLMDSKRVVVGAQNAYPVANGSFTGEIGLDQLDEYAIRSILIGHSERRHVLGEAQTLIEEKFNFFKAQDFTVTYCIGEPLEVREEGLDAVMAYLHEQIGSVDTGYDKLIVAYEPVWAIGTGVTATLEDIQATHDALKQRYGFASLLYGGSVKVENVASILSIGSVDGVLIGTASWQADHFCEILNQSKQAKGE